MEQKVRDFCREEVDLSDIYSAVRPVHKYTIIAVMQQLNINVHNKVLGTSCGILKEALVPYFVSPNRL